MGKADERQTPTYALAVATASVAWVASKTNKSKGPRPLTNCPCLAGAGNECGALYILRGHKVKSDGEGILT